MRILATLLLSAFLVPVDAASRAAALPVSNVPFMLDLDGAVIVPVGVQGDGPFGFVLDTGSSHSVISDTLAARLALPAVARSEMATSAGVTMVPVVRVESVALGAVTADGLLASVLGAADLRRFGRDVDGVLGQDFLAGRNFTIDYRGKRLLWDAVGMAAAASATRLPLVMQDGRPVATLRQHDTEPLRLVPDSGSNTIVLYERERRPSLRLSPVAGGRGAGLLGLAGVRAARLMQVDELQVGQLTLRNRVAVLVAPSSEAHNGVDGLLPLHGFSRVSFRPEDGALVIEP